MSTHILHTIAIFWTNRSCPTKWYYYFNTDDLLTKRHNHTSLTQNTNALCLILDRKNNVCCKILRNKGIHKPSEEVAKVK